MKWFSVDAPRGWVAVFVRTVNTAIVAFAVLQLKEYLDAHSFDTPGTALDAAWIAAGVLALSAILKWAKA